jgi:hypothetical protein
MVDETEIALSFRDNVLSLLNMPTASGRDHNHVVIKFQFFQFHKVGYFRRQRGQLVVRKDPVFSNFDRDGDRTVRGMLEKKLLSNASCFKAVGRGGTASGKGVWTQGLPQDIVTGQECLQVR